MRLPLRGRPDLTEKVLKGPPPTPNTRLRKRLPTRHKTQTMPVFLSPFYARQLESDALISPLLRSLFNLVQQPFLNIYSKLISVVPTSEAVMATILIVDDERVFCDLLQTMLGSHGHEVFTAYNGREALDLFSQHRPQFTLLDLRMPEMNGIEVL